MTIQYVWEDNTGTLQYVTPSYGSGVPATSVTGPDAYGAAAVVGTSTNDARQDHDHGLPAATAGTPATAVVGPDAYGAAAAVGTSTNYARQDHDHGLPASASFIQTAAATSRYDLWFDGTNYHLVNRATGTATTGTSGSTLLNNLLGSAGTAPHIVYIDPAISITDAAVTIGQSNCALISHVRGYQNANGALIGQIQLTNKQSKQENVTLQGFSFHELDFLPTSTGSNINAVDCIDMTVLASGGAGQAGIVMDGSAGGYVQYCAFRGHTVVICHNDFTAASSYPGGWFHTKSAGNGQAHIYFEDVEVLHNITTQNCSDVHYIGTAATTQDFTVTFERLDTNCPVQTTGFCSVVEVDTASTFAVAGQVDIRHLRNESHQTAGYIGYFLLTFTGSGTATHTLRIDVDRFEVSGSGTLLGMVNTLALLAPTTYAFTGGASSGIYIDHYIGKSTGSTVFTFGTPETANFPVWIGESGVDNAAVPATQGIGAQGHSLSGSLISTPVAGTLLSVGGTASWAAGTTYTVGGSKLAAVVTGTVTLKDPAGNVLINAVALTNAVIPLLRGMSFLVATGGTAVFYKAT